MTAKYGGECRISDEQRQDAEVCDEGHCYCDNPHQCRWNRSTGPVRPNRQPNHHVYERDNW